MVEVVMVIMMIIIMMKNRKKEKEARITWYKIQHGHSHGSNGSD